MARSGTDPMTCGGCALSALGATAAPLLWLSMPRTRRHLGGGFENEGMDLTVLFTELPLVVLGGAFLPLLAFTVLARVRDRRRL
ncbi:hypothetical protein [Streptomyces sp. NRRL B-24085]|uniref:hypothetical protein n=1 Tax=Streptomyces sp. NRRL B-24085 TaxID=1709476 RepID=UPI0007C7ADFF|nr:hypothetical protein [Streptomyces sp. NRRL B-24085]